MAWQVPPVDMFTGENAEVRFEDRLPSLQQAANWDGCRRTTHPASGASAWSCIAGMTPPRGRRKSHICHSDKNAKRSIRSRQ